MPTRDAQMRTIGAHSLNQILSVDKHSFCAPLVEEQQS